MKFKIYKELKMSELKKIISIIMMYAIAREKSVNLTMKKIKSFCASEKH